MDTTPQNVCFINLHIDSKHFPNRIKRKKEKKKDRERKGENGGREERKEKRKEGSN